MSYVLSAANILRVTGLTTMRGIQQVQINVKIDFESIFIFDFLLPRWLDFGHTANELWQLPGMTACANAATRCYTITVKLRIRMGSQCSVQENSLL